MFGATHTAHEDTHTHGLADDCPRCAEHAQHPFESLDSENLVAVYRRVRNGFDARSDAEAEAMRQVESVMRRHETLVRALTLRKEEA